jgi:hypothetical protein
MKDARISTELLPKRYTETVVVGSVAEKDGVDDKGDYATKRIARVKRMPNIPNLSAILEMSVFERNV